MSEVAEKTALEIWDSLMIDCGTEEENHQQIDRIAAIIQRATGQLEHENTAMRDSQCTTWHLEKLLAKNAALKQALDAQMQYQRELRADRDRLDWLLTHEGGSWLYWACEMGQWTPEVGASRAAIDAAQKEAQP